MHSKGNCCMISDDIEGHSSFARVHIIPCTLRPIFPASSCICMTQSDSMVLSGYHFFRWDQAAPPNASHLCTKLGIACWMSGHCYHSALNESHPWKLYLATLGCYLSRFWPRTLPNPSPVSCYLTFPSSSPSEPHLYISSKTSPPVVAESIRHYKNFPKAARPRKFPKNLQLPSPSAGVYFATVSNSSVLGLWTDASSRDSQPPILSSSCWRY